MEGSASNVQEVPRMGAESKMKIEEPKVGERFADYFTKEFDALDLSDAVWTDLQKWKLTEEEKGTAKAIEHLSSTAPYNTYNRERIVNELFEAMSNSLKRMAGVDVGVNAVTEQEK